MSTAFDKDEIMKVISEFVYFSSQKDLFQLLRDEKYLNNDKDGNGTLYVFGDNFIKKYYNDNSLEYKRNIEQTMEGFRNKECEDRKWIDKLDKKCKLELNEDFIPLILKRTNIAIDLIKRPSSFSELDINNLVDILYNRDLRQEHSNSQTLAELIYRDNNCIIYKLYGEMKKTIKYLDQKQNSQVMYATIIGLIIATEKSSNFPQTLAEAYNIFYNEVFNMFSNVCGHMVLQYPKFYPIIYFNKMPNEFFKAIPIINENNEKYDIRIELQNMLKNCVEDNNWILEKKFDKKSLHNLCFLVLTDCFSVHKMNINSKSKFEFAFCLFLLIIKIIPKQTLTSAEYFWQNDTIKEFMFCCISDEVKDEVDKIKNEIQSKGAFTLDNKVIKNAIIQKVAKDLDFSIFIFIIANRINDKEILDLITDKDDIKSLAFDNNDKLMKLIEKLNDHKIKEILQAVDNYFILKTNRNADDLVSILQNTHDDLGTSYNEELTFAIHDIISSKIEYEDIYNEIKNKVRLKVIREETDRERIYELLGTGEYYLKVTNARNYAPSVNQYCSALERLLNEIIYKPYFFEIQNICLKNNNRYFRTDEAVIKKYFGDTPHAMWFKNNKLSVMGLGDLKTLMEKICENNYRLSIFIKATKGIFKNIDIKAFLIDICKSLEIIKPDRDKASHGEIINREQAETVRAKVYENEKNEKLNPSDLILKIDRDLK